jgi:ParB-like nuclease domain
MFESIALSKLQLSASNVRKVLSPEADLQLSHDIEARGLLQNLIVSKAKKRGHFDVIAGGRRLRAMTLIVDRGAWTKDHQVSCLVINGDEATISETSLAENFQRMAMLGHVSRVSFDRKDYRAVCLFQAARSAYPKSWRRAAWNKHLRGGCGILRCGISVASPSRGRLVDLLARLSAQHI